MPFAALGLSGFFVVAANLSERRGRPWHGVFYFFGFVLTIGRLFTGSIVPPAVLTFVLLILFKLKARNPSVRRRFLPASLLVMFVSLVPSSIYAIRDSQAVERLRGRFPLVSM